VLPAGRLWQDAILLEFTTLTIEGAVEAACAEVARVRDGR
jgi:hypothetical protein